ncbi:MAG: hypothetical protein AAF752_16715, partial [Bacteroidota bacterium]
MRTLGTFVLLFVLGFTPALAQEVSSIPFNTPTRLDGLFADEDGSIYAAGTFNGTQLFSISPLGQVQVVAEGLGGPIQATRSPVDGNFYVTNFVSGELSRVTPTGTVTQVGELPSGPAGITADPDGNLYIAIYGVGNGTGRQIMKVTPSGRITRFASGGTINIPVGIASDDEGNVYAGNFFDGRITKITPAGEASLFAQLPQGSPWAIGHMVWAGGFLYATATSQNQIYQVDAAGNAVVFAGSGSFGQNDGPLAEATFAAPNGISAKKDGSVVYVSDQTNPSTRIRRIAVPVGTSTEEEVPEDIGFLQAYPNPFEGNTKLAFTLDRPTNLTLT